MTQRLNIPELNNIIIGWIYNQAYQQLWKIQWYDFEDLVQDGLLIALKCRERYPDAESAHLLALIKTSFRNHIVNLQRTTGANSELLFAEIPDISFVSEGQTLDVLLEPELPEQEFACALSELPESIKSVLRLFLSPDSLRRLRLPLRETLYDSETPAKRLRRLAGWPEEKDFASELEKQLFNG